LDDNGVPGVYETIVHPKLDKFKNGRPAYAKHTLLDYRHGRYPFVVGCKERHCRDITSSRGVPERVRSRQREIKVQRDSIVDHTSMSTLPSILVPLTAAPRAAGSTAQFKFGPASQVPYRPGAKPEFMDPPPSPGLAFELIQTIEKEMAYEFGLISELVPPSRTMSLQQKETSSFLRMWEEAFQQVFALIRQYMPPEQWARVTGSQKPADDKSEIDGQFDLILSFDVRELDVDHMKEKIAALTQVVLPVDAGGIIDRTKLVQLLLRAIDPSLLNELVSDPVAASEAIYKGVQNDIAIMALGDEPLYNQGTDPTASRQLEYAQRIVFGGPMGGGNPKYQQQYQQDPQFKDLFDNWVKNRMQSVKQNENRTIGRTGVAQIQGPGV
jgi:hypothetical protein